MMREVMDFEQYFMVTAIVSALRSKDPHTKVGACVVNKENRIVATGYNGFVNQSLDEEFPWDNAGEFLDTKYPFVCHAELNAIANSVGSLKGCTVYTTLYPCNECAKLIIQSGITKVVYLSDKYKDTNSCKASSKIFESVGVECVPFNHLGECFSININGHHISLGAKNDLEITPLF